MIWQRVTLRAFFLFFATSVACSPNACPTGDVPASCPSSGAPSYQGSVSLIIQTQCTSCHSPGGVEPNRPLVVYSDVFNQRQSVLTQVDACLMPQGYSLPPDQRAALLTWLVCGAPNN